MAIGLPALPGLGDAMTPVVAPNAPLTPQAIAAQREYAKALMTGERGKGGAQFPVVQSWTQGVSNMVNALIGGGEAYNANQREQNSIDKTNPAGVPTTTPVKTSFNDGPSSEGHEKTADEGMSKQAKAIASVESDGSGGYSAIGPATRTGDRAYGKYQVMGANIPSWTSEVLGKPMTPEEFLGSPQAQDAVFKTKFAQGGNNDTDRASVWFTGKPYAQGAGKSDGYITGAQYVDRFNKGMGSPGGSAMAFAGPDGGSSASPAVQAMSSALRGGDNTQVAENTQVAASKGAAPGTRSPLPEPNGNGIYVDPRLVQKRPQYTPEQMNAVMNHPVLTPEAKFGILQQYQQQNQPIEVPYPGGKVIIDPNNPTRQQYIPDLQKGEKSIGEIKGPSYGTMQPVPGGGVQFNPAQTAPAPVGPRSEAAPAAAPQGAPAPASGAPIQPAEAAPAPATGAAPAPVKVASTDPTAGVAAAAGGAPAPTPATAPAVPPTNPLAKMVQAGPPPGVSQQDWEAYTQKKGYDNKVAQDQESALAKIAVDKESQSKAVDAAAKKYDTLSTQAQAARKQMPNLDLALALMNDPNFHTGLAAGAQDVWARLKAATGIDAMANAPNEAFDKIMAGTILDNMKTALGGLGQVRVAEINLLTRANANRTNTDASNRAVLEVSRRAVQKVDQLDQLGQQYSSGDEVVDPLSGEVLLKANAGKDGEITPRHGLDVGYDKLARKFTLDHPSFTPEEVKRYETIFDTGKDPNQATAEPATTGETKVGTEKQFKQGIGVWDGKQWVPKK